MVQNLRVARKFFSKETLRELAKSIEAQGVIQPIIVRRVEGGYEIVAGERRWRASKMAGREEIPAIVVDLNEKEALVRSLVENIHREELTSIEKENAIYELWKSGNYKTYEELGKALGYDRASVYHILEAKEFRLRNKNVVADNISTYEIRLTSGLSDDERVEILKKKGSMSTSSFESFMRLYKASDEEYRKKALFEASSLVEVNAKLELYKKASAPSLRKALKEGKVSEEQARSAIEVKEKLEAGGVKVDGRKVATLARHLVREKEEWERKKEWGKEWEEREYIHILAPRARLEKPKLEKRGEHPFAHKVIDIAAEIRRWAQPKPLYMKPNEWKKAREYLEEMSGNIELLRRRAVFWSSESYIEVYCDAGQRSNKPMWELVAYRVNGGRKELIHEDAGPIVDEVVSGGNTPMEAYAAIQALKWIKATIKDGTIKENEGVVLFEDNNAIYFKLVKDLPGGGWSYLYNEMIELAKPLKDSGRLVIEGIPSYLNLAHGVSFKLAKKI
jgi:ParB family chromosome partitioning protein